MTRFLLYLPALACPVLMLVCMAGMRRMHSPHAQARRARPPAGTDQRIAQLEQELAAQHAERQKAGDPAQATQTAPADPHAERQPAPADRVS